MWIVVWKWVERLPGELGNSGSVPCVRGRDPLGSCERTHVSLAYCRHLDDFVGEAGPPEYGQRHQDISLGA